MGTSCKTDTEGFWGIVRETRMVIYFRRNAVTVAESWCLNSSEGAKLVPYSGKPRLEPAELERSKILVELIGRELLA